MDHRFVFCIVLTADVVEVCIWDWPQSDHHPVHWWLCTRSDPRPPGACRRCAAPRGRTRARSSSGHPTPAPRRSCTSGPTGSGRVWAPLDTQTWRARPQPQTPVLAENISIKKTFRGLKLSILQVMKSTTCCCIIDHCNISLKVEASKTTLLPPHLGCQWGTLAPSAPRPRWWWWWTGPAWCGPASAAAPC